MQRIWAEIDLHIVAMLVMLALGLCLGWWWLAVLILLPQGRICTKTFWDKPAFGQPLWPYLVANEVLVFASVGLMSAIRVGFTTLRE